MTDTPSAFNQPAFSMVRVFSWRKLWKTKKSGFYLKRFGPSLAVVLAALGSQFGVELVSTELSDTLYGAVTGIAGLVALVGRFSAKSDPGYA